MSAIRPAEIALFHALNAAGPAALEPVMHALSWLGHYARAPVYATGLMLIAVAFRRYGRQAAAQASAAAAYTLLIGFAIAVPLTAALKQSFAQSRPAAVLEHARVLAAADSQFSFPSGHAMFVGLVAASVWPALGAWGRAAVALFAAAVAVSRVWLGAHFPSDVAIGLLLGVGAGVCAGWLLRRWRSDKSVALAFGLALLVLVLDAGTKTLVASGLGLDERLGLTEFLNIVNWRNTGAAFGLWSDVGGWQRPIVIVVALALSVWLIREIVKADNGLVYRLGYSSILGGALANVFDRSFRGAVVDWLDFHWRAQHWPAFNVADVAITAGIGVLVLRAIVQRKQPLRDAS